VCGPLVALAAVVITTAGFLTPLRADLVAGSPVVVQGETLAPGNQIADPNAAGGAFARAKLVQGNLGVVAGPYILRARVKAANPARAELIVAGELVGAWTTKTTWKEIDGLVWLNAGEPVGVRATPPTGGTLVPNIDVDWVSLEATTPAITARGTRMLLPDGTPWVSRGMNFPAMHVPKAWGGRLQLVQTVPAEDFYRWGASMVRLQLNQEHWIADCPAAYGFQPMTYREAVITAVNALISQGIAVLATLTVVERGQATGCATAQSPVLKEMADLRSLIFWRSMAQTFGNQPLVLFDLFNEPRDITVGVWRNGGTTSYKTWVNGVRKTKYYTATGMQKILDAIRSEGARNAVTVSGTQWAGKPDVLVSNPLDGAGIIAALHVYCHDCPANDPHLTATFGQANDAARARFPVIVTETGWAQSNDPTFNRLVIDWAEANADGWSIYQFLPPDHPCVLVKEWDQQSLDVGGGIMTIAPSFRGASTWNSLAAERVARGFDAALRPE
jgi:hypothetical protein